MLQDTLAALALATESPTEELLNRPPYGRVKPIISPTILKNIFGHAVYQLIVIFVLLYSGDVIFGIGNGRTSAVASSPTQHMTLVFNAFVLMTLFNMFNARKVHNERNVFDRLFSNQLFCGIWTICFVVQVMPIFKICGLLK